MNDAIRTERRVGVTSRITPSAARNLYVLTLGETWPDLLDVLEMTCIEVETVLINTDPSKAAEVLANHKLSKAAWMMFEMMQAKIIEASNTYLQSAAKQPVVPEQTQEEKERDQLLNPTLHLTDLPGDDGIEERFA